MVYKRQPDTIKTKAQEEVRQKMAGTTQQFLIHFIIKLQYGNNKIARFQTHWAKA
jgi:hypothetical protein